jgi:glucosamine--fructose-6-phosphate aminotransferase (isomerizing)
MCGIIGYLGVENGFNISMEGLEQLKNRGYDSSGYCGIVDGELKCAKFASLDGVDSMALLKSTPENVNCLIAHCRWATTGPKTTINAHPHLDYTEQIAVVHNGTIENYMELKIRLREYGISFKSQTDTEVIANLISYYYNNVTDKHMEEAIMTAVRELKGTWALVIICRDKPDNLYCARHGSPLLVGFAQDYIMVASEQAGFCNYVSNYVCLNNSDVTVIRRRDGKVNFRNVENYMLKRVTSNRDELTPHPYQHWTLKEINEQYEASIRAISFGGRLQDDNRVMLGGPQQHINVLRHVDHLLLLGCGTSLHAARYGVHYFTDLCNFTTVQAIDGTEFTSHHIPKRGMVCVVFLSQSGESRDLHRCISIARDANCFTLGIINVVDSQIARDVDCGCYIHAGREVAVASTKSYSNQIILLSMLAIFFAQIHDLNSEKRRHYIKQLRQLPMQILSTIQNVDTIAKDIAKYLKSSEHLFLLGKGTMVPIAEEGALKIKELGYINANGMPLLLMRHGVYALLRQGTSVMFINANDDNYGMVCNTVEEVISREGVPIMITDKCDNDLQHIDKLSKFLVKVPENDVFRGILLTIPLQLIAYYVALERNNTVDTPSNLAKTVSV